MDALTYGLATLCMGDIFIDHSQKHSVPCRNCGTLNQTSCQHDLPPADGPRQRRLGNQYPQFTRKFSLGNGPADWVQEYLITKESGKMLGTLVALAVARMVNLETFVWDMPTGVLRDVWLALSSLQSRSSNQESRLERVWVRWHDNYDQANANTGHGVPPGSNITPQMLTGSTLSSIGWSIEDGWLPRPQPPLPAAPYTLSRVEYPTLSVLPALKSLSVLDIDELEYLDEMAILIARSKDKLRELRVGISSKAVTRDFTFAWDGPNLQQVDHNANWPGESRIGERRLGGVLGILLGRVFDIRKRTKPKPEERKNPVASGPPPAASGLSISTHAAPSSPSESATVISNETGTSVTANVHVAPISATTEDVPKTAVEDVAQVSSMPEHDLSPAPEVLTHEPLAGLSNPVEPITHVTDGAALQIDETSPSTILSAALGGSGSETPVPAVNDTLTSSDVATLNVDDAAHTSEHLHRRSLSAARKPAPVKDQPPQCRERLDGKLKLHILELERVALSVAVLQKAFDWTILTDLTILDCPQHERLWTMLRRQFQPTTASDHASKHSASPHYHLNLKKIHTDAASPALVVFLKETLAPNTLETLFLQDRRRTVSTSITIVSRLVDVTPILLITPGRNLPRALEAPSR